ncbi:MAG: hypothetical protein V1745_00585 [Patescibacteria group bacterium]
MTSPRPLRSTPLPTLPSEASMASDLDASQAEDRFSQEGRPSPLELPAKSYTEVPEYAQQREKEQAMVRSGEQFVGAPVVPSAQRTAGGAGPSEAAPGQEASRRRTRQGAAETSEEIGPQEDARKAAALQEQQDEDRHLQRQAAEREREEAKRKQQGAAIANQAKQELKRKIMLRVAPVLAPCCFYTFIIVAGLLIQITIVAAVVTKAVNTFDIIAPWFK